MKHFQLSLLFIYSLSAAQSHHFNCNDQQESPCDNPALGEQGHLQCQDFEFFIKAAQQKKQETETSWFEWAWPLWKIKHDQSLQQVRAVQDDINYYETLLSKKRPDHYRKIFEDQLTKNKLLFNAMKQIADKEKFEKLYEERHSIQNSFSTTLFPLSLTAFAWYMQGMPAYTHIQAGLHNKLSDSREINSTYSLWAVTHTLAQLATQASVPHALATGNKKSMALAGTSLILYPLIHKGAQQYGYASINNKAEIILSPNARIATGLMEATTWGTMLYNILAGAYYLRQQKDNYPFKEKEQERTTQ